jgi:NADH-quinone oxidoreductase subunit N
MTSTLVLASLPEIFLCTAICLLLTYGVLPNPRNTSVGTNGRPYDKLISARLGHSLPHNATVPTLKGLEHDPAGKPVASERDPFTLVDGPTRGLFDGLAAYKRRAWLSCFTVFRTGLLCLNADGFTSATTFLYDPAGSRVKTVLLGVALLLFALATQPTQKLYPFERLVLRLGAIAGLRFLISAYDLVAFYLALELQSFCLYILAARKRTSEFSTEAGIKYFMLGAFSSGWILFGSALIYGFTGTTNFEDLGNLFSALSLSASTGRGGVEALGIQGDGSIAGDTVALSRSYLFGSSSFLGLEGVLVGRIFVRVGLFFKLAAAPFHLWAPDVYEGAPTFVTAFFAVVPKIALLTVFFRLFFGVFEFAFAAVTQPRLATVAALSRIFGTLGGLYQVKIKRLRAYSAIGHMGYRLRGRSSGTLEGVQAVFLYRGIYRLTSLGFFTVLLRVKKVKSSQSSEDTNENGSGSSEGTSLVYLTDLVDLGKSNPYLGVIVARLFFSMAGVPPLAGFFAKYYVFFAAVSAEQYGLALLAVITSTASCFYYLRVVKFRYFTGPDAAKGRAFSEWPRFRAVPSRHAFVLVVITRFILGFFFCPEPFLLGAQSIAYALVA